MIFFYIFMNRVTLPKKCRAEESSRQIVKLACSIKVKRLLKYQQEYEKFIKGKINRIILETTQKWIELIFFF